MFIYFGQTQCPENRTIKKAGMVLSPHEAFSIMEREEYEIRVI